MKKRVLWDKLNKRECRKSFGSLNKVDYLCYVNEKSKTGPYNSNT